MNLNKSSKYSILTLAMTLSLLMLISCGNNPKPASTDNSEVDTTAISAPKPQPTDTAEHKATPRSKEEVKKEWDEYNCKNGYGLSSSPNSWRRFLEGGNTYNLHDHAKTNRLQIRKSCIYTVQHLDDLIISDYSDNAGIQVPHKSFFTIISSFVFFEWLLCRSCYIIIKAFSGNQIKNF